MDLGLGKLIHDALDSGKAAFKNVESIPGIAKDLETKVSDHIKNEILDKIPAAGKLMFETVLRQLYENSGITNNKKENTNEHNVDIPTR